MKKSILRPFRSNLSKLAIALLPFSAIGCGDDNDRGDLLFDGMFGKQRVVYFNDPDRLEIYRENGNLAGIIEDDDNDDEIGNDDDDKYTEFLEDGGQRVHTKDYFVDEYGTRFEEGEDSLSDKVVEHSRSVLRKATIDYRNWKSKMANLLKAHYTSS